MDFVKPARLKAMRETAGLTAEQMGDRIGCGRRAVQRIELPGSGMNIFPGTVEKVEDAYYEFLDAVDDMYADLREKVECGCVEVEYYKSQKHFAACGKVGDHCFVNAVARAACVILSHEGVEVDWRYPESVDGSWPPGFMGEE